MNPKDQYFFSSALKLLFLTGLLVVAAIPFFLWTIQYNDFIHSILVHYGIQDKEEVLRSRYLTRTAFQGMRYISLLLAAGYTLVLPVLIRKSGRFAENILTNLKKTGSIIRNEVGALKSEELIVVALVTLVSLLLKLWYFFKVPFLIDEAFSYVYFVSKGAPVTASYYPAPNNHILSNLLSCGVQLFTDNALLIMRLPSLLISLVLGLVVFLFYKKHFSFATAITAYLFYSLCFEMNFYAVQGRGYLLFTLCSFLLMIISFQYLSASRSVYLRLFAAVSIAGFYTIPTFIYPFAASILFLHVYFYRNRDFSPLLKLYGALAATVAGVLLLYIPVLLVSGVSSIVANSWVKPLELSHWIQAFPAYGAGTANWLLNIETGGIFFLLFTGLSYLVTSSGRFAKTFLWFSIIYVLTPLVLIGIQRVLPFYRIWLYFIPIIGLYVGHICEGLRKSYLKITCSLALAAAMLFADLRAFEDDFGFYEDMNRALRKVVQDMPENVYCEEDTYYVFLNYYGIKNHVRFNIEDTFVADRLYDYLILKPDSQIPHQGYDRFVENEDVKVYVRRK